MPPVSHEPSSLIAIRDLHALEQQRRAEERAHEAAEAQARAAAEAEARRLAEARDAAEQAAAEQARRDRERRAEAERLRVAELETRVRGLQAAHLASVEAELASAARDVRRARTRDLLISAAAFGAVGLGLAFLLQVLGQPPAPVLAATGDDPTVSQARREIERIRGQIKDLEQDHQAARAALTDALLPRPEQPAQAPIAAPSRPRPRPTAARPQPTPTPVKKPGNIVICKTDDPLAEDC